MTEQEFKVINTIYEHQQKVGSVMLKVINELIHRALTHDASKFTTQQLRDNLVTLPDKWRLQQQDHGYQAPNRRNTGKNLHLRFIDIEVPIRITRNTPPMVSMI